MNKKRVLVIGLDGATFELLQPWMDEGALPAFRALIERGARAVLRSTIPPLTPPAWVSSVTGVNPGKHGIFDFTKGREHYRAEPVHSGDWRAEPIWLRLGREGFRVGVMNFPLTYPPLPVNGFLLSGMLTPSRARDFFHPPELAERVGPSLSGAGLRLDEKNLHYGRRRAFLRDLARTTERQTELAIRLVRMFDVDVLQIVYDGLDRLQHYFWRFLDEADASVADAQAIRRYYQRLDRSLATLMSHLAPDGYVLVYSDHGFGPLRWRIHVEELLVEWGLLTWREAPEPRSSREWMEALAYKLGVGTLLKRWLPTSLKNVFPPAPLTPYTHIDWYHTKAFFASMSNQSIRLNLRGREPQGIVEPGREYESIRQRIIDGLMALEDPVTHQPLIQQVYRREDLYHGPHVQRADDLIISAAPGVYLVGGRSERTISGREERWGWSGTHRADGLFILAGPGVKYAHQLEPARIEDVAPTILYLMGVPVPDYMDGAVLLDAFQPEFVRAHPVIERSEPLLPGPTIPGEYEAEKTELLSRLRNLGYIE